MGFSEESGQKSPSGNSNRIRKAPRRITPEYLERAALYYLERYSSSEANLRRVLQLKVHRSCRHHGDDPLQFATAIDAVVMRKVNSGLIDDRRYAESRAASLKRKGTSQRMIGLKLGAKGISRDLVASLGQDDEEAEMSAARIAARRKKLGPWRTRGARQDYRQKDIAALMRAGFGSAVARAIVDLADIHDADLRES